MRLGTVSGIGAPILIVPVVQEEQLFDPVPQTRKGTAELDVMVAELPEVTEVTPTPKVQT